MSCALRLKGITFGYHDTRVLTDFSLSVDPGELVAVLGRSGCGKTTVLKLIAGLIAPIEGHVEFDGVSVNALPAEKRRAAMVFQKPLLFPHLNVAENIGFSLKMRRANPKDIARRVSAALDEVKLEGYGSRAPSELSGGQEQRVSLARALASDPKILLLDEPFSALDENLRHDMRLLLKRIQRRLKITTVFVTHDQHEAAGIADRIALVVNGQIEQEGPPRDFYTAPRTLAAAHFFGWQTVPRELSVSAVFRPELATLRKQPDGPGVQATVDASVDFGHRARTTVRSMAGDTLEVDHPPPAFAEGDCVTLVIPASAICIIKE